MAGFRDFQTGEVLTAANVNDFLSKQAVMKFADASARDTALGTATGGSNALREGMASYLDDTDALQIYDGSAWATVANAGLGTNVVQTVKTDVFSISSAGPSTVTGLTATITPSSTSSKVLVIVSAAVSNNNMPSDQFLSFIYRGSTPLMTMLRLGVSSSMLFQTTGVYLDSPATTSPVTYEMRLQATPGSTAYLNGDTSGNDQTDSTITAIEVAA